MPFFVRLSDNGKTACIYDVVYKISDPFGNELYGFTTDFTKHQHDLKRKRAPQHEIDFISNAGGWDNIKLQPVKQVSSVSFVDEIVANLQYESDQRNMDQLSTIFDDHDITRGSTKEMIITCMDVCLERAFQKYSAEFEKRAEEIAVQQVRMLSSKIMELAECIQQI